MVCGLVGSLEATSGSDMAKAERMWPVQQGFQPLRALLRIGKPVQQLHVAGIGALQLNTSLRPMHPPHAFGQGRIVQDWRPFPVRRSIQAGQEQVPQPLLTSEGLQVLQERRRIHLLHACMPGRVVGST